MNDHDKLLAIEDEIRCWLHLYDTEIKANDGFGSTVQRILRLEAVAKYNAAKNILDFVVKLLDNDTNTVKYALEKSGIYERPTMNDSLQRLEDYRLNNKLSVKDIAGMLSVSDATIYAWYRGIGPGKINKRQIEKFVESTSTTYQKEVKNV